MSTSGNRVFLNNVLLANKRHQKNSLGKKNEKRKNEKREIPGSQKNLLYYTQIRREGVKNNTISIDDLSLGRPDP